MTLTSELLELSQHLQSESLFTSNEREQLQKLYNNITVVAEQLNHSAWVLRRQKLNLQKFWQQGNLGENSDAYAINNQLEDTKFVDSYKVFSYHDSKYGELFRFLYENPTLIAAVLLVGDAQEGVEVDSVINLTLSSIYSNCILVEDETAMLKVMKTLLEKQVGSSINPRRLFSRTNTAFTKAYRQICDSLFSARLFLTAALYEPIMRLLMEDEWFHDIDPDKALVRFPQQEKLRKFGEPGTADHKAKLDQYRKETVDKLVQLASRFINSIKSNIHCFPASLGWLISQVYRVLTERGQVSMQEIRTSCADLVFDRFICPAICDPEPFGITSDVPISHISRHNLMQMAKIIQVLAISQWEGIDPKVQDLYGRFGKGCMSSVLDLFFEGSWDDFVEQMGEGGVGSKSDASQESARSCVLVTTSEVKDMVGFLKSTAGHLDDKVTGKTTLETLLSTLPAETSSGLEGSANHRAGVVISPSVSPLAVSSTGNYSPDGTRKALFKSKGHKKKVSSTVAPTQEDLCATDPGLDPDSAPCDVLVVSIRHPVDCPGMLPEKKVLSSHGPVESKHTTFNMNNQQHQHQPPSQASAASAPPLVAPNPEIQEKRTRFSLSHDQESIGNASDYQEVISEAASSHSVEDEENELETDNFSDMISANVSGRGSPSISGRDTPLSQAGSVEENPVTAQLPVAVPVTVRKENRVDVTDRFGKFEIKAELVTERDEFQSTVSDTWSTDVLASDSEPPESNQVDRLEEVAEEISRPPYLSEPISEISETASDAWSTDVLASDTDEKHSELLKDLEQDLLVGNIEREEGDGSVGHEEGEEHQPLEADHLGIGGAVGGAGNTSHPPVQSDSCDTFPDVFSEPHTPSQRSAQEDPFQSSCATRKNYTTSTSSTSSSISGVVHSSTSLQLPSISTHRQSSPRGSEARQQAVGFSGLHEPVIHSSTGARSKIKDKDIRKKSREIRSSGGASHNTSGGGGGIGGRGIGSGISIAGGDDSGGGDFDPLSSGGSSSGSSKGWKDCGLSGGGGSGGGRHQKDGLSSQGPRFDSPGLDMSDLVTRPIHHPSTSTPTHRREMSPPHTRRDANQARNSGIDIWVSSNGQVSGNSPHSTVLSSHSSFDSNSDSFLPQPAASQGSLEQPAVHTKLNLQSLQNSPATFGSSTPDSGLESSSSLFRPLGGNPDHFSPQHLDIESQTFPLIPGTFANSSSSGPAVSDQANFRHSSGRTGENSYSNLMKHHDGNSCSSPQVVRAAAGKRTARTNSAEAIDMIKKMSFLEDGPENSTTRGMEGNGDADNNNMKLVEQQFAGMTERRFSAALSMFDPFPPGFEDQSMDIKESSSCDFGFKWEESALPPSSGGSGGQQELESVEEGQGQQQNASRVLVKVLTEEEVVEGKKLVEVGEEEEEESAKKLRPRRDSSGSSSHSTSSLKGNVSQGESSGNRESGGDNLSMILDDKEFQEEDGMARNKKSSGFFSFRSVRDKFQKVKRKNTRLEKDLNDVSEGGDSSSSPTTGAATPTSSSSKTSTGASRAKEPALPNPPETTDDILAKYRKPKKPTSLTKNNNSPAVANNNIVAGEGVGASASRDSTDSASNRDSTNRNSVSSNARTSSTLMSEEEQRPFYDPNNIEGCPAFHDAKRKLRLVLSNGLISSCWPQVHSSSPRSSSSSRENELTHLLKTQLAEAINLHSKDRVAQLYEVVRCVRPFDLDGCKKLVSAMKADYKARSPYVAYLIRCRNRMLATRSHLQCYLNRINRDKEISGKHLANMSAQRFLDRREKHMWRFISEFKKLTMADEKIDLLECFLNHLYSEMMQDPLWKPATEQQLEDAKLALERFVMSRIYTAAMFPNGEGDVMRDQLLQEHLGKLSQVISLSHKDIRIPAVYHMECPWPAAQREIFSINAYKTPKDKIQCVLRCSKTILNLLSLAANQKAVPAADDFLPVLIFVLIKANPFGLLSTIQYVNSFYGNRLQGEEHYWWMQLTSAVEFIKNMNYSP